MMQRRTFLRRLLGTLCAVATGSHISKQRNHMLIQVSPIAGFQYYRGDTVWPSLVVGEHLSLLRESNNEYDPDAVAVYFHNEQLGYVPRSENGTIAQMLDRGENLEARIRQLLTEDDPWKRVRRGIFLA